MAGIFNRHSRKKISMIRGLEAGITAVTVRESNMEEASLREVDIKVIKMEGIGDKYLFEFKIST